jgi:hypothetical protein
MAYSAYPVRVLSVENADFGGPAEEGSLEVGTECLTLWFELLPSGETRTVAIDLAQARELVAMLASALERANDP